VLLYRFISPTLALLTSVRFFFFLLPMADQNPPAYSEKGVRDSDVAPPLPPPPQSYTVQTVTAETYTAPTQFEIGSQTTPEPLVKISQVKCHLALLHAFAELKKQVEGLQEPIPQMPADLEKRWAWFVGLAVERSVI